MGWNPANWQITDSLQGQSGGINPLKAVAKYTSPLVFVADSTKDFTGNPLESTSSWNSGGAVVDNSRPVATSGTNQATATGSGGGGGGSSVDWTSIADAQDLVSQAQNLLNSFGGKRDIFNSNLANTYGKYRSQLQSDFGRNQGNYNQNRVQTITDQQNAKQRIDSQVRGRASSLQRLLGAAGAGDSSAALELAPYAAARTGTKLRTQVNDQYGRNLQGLDQSWGQYNTDYNNSLGSLNDQEAAKRSEFETSLLNQELSARDNIRKGQSALTYAQTGNAAQARAIREQALPQLYQILQQIDALSRQQVTPNVQDATYSAPELAQYTTENVQPVGGVDPTQADNVDPFYQWLLKKSEEDNQTFGY